MNKALVTGLNGRLVPYLKSMLESRGVEVIPFDRNVIDITSSEQQRVFIQDQEIDAIFHLATGPESWVGTLGSIAKDLSIPFLFTSTESVFNPDSIGPFTPDHPADATGDYGRYKIACEQEALKANPDTIIARLGWQMFDTFDQDNMLTHVRDMHDENGYLYASTKWLPAVAFVNDTMTCLVDLMNKSEPGIYHIGGNENGLSFYQLVQMINRKYQCGWDVREGDDPDRDGRIIDSRVPVGLIEDALK